RNTPVDMDLSVLLGKPPRMRREAKHTEPRAEPFDPGTLELREAAYHVLQFPAVADKTFLVTIGDRTVGGLCARDPMVGPWPVPDARRVVTPQLRLDRGATVLLLVDLGDGKNRLGASALAQVYGRLGDAAPDLDDAQALKDFFTTVQTLHAQDRLFAYHDRSDG